MDYYFDSIYEKMLKNLEKDRECPFASNLLFEKIIYQNGCYYFDSRLPKYSKDPPDIFDRIGSECFHNKIFIRGIIENNSKNKTFECGILFAEKLAAKLSAELGTGFNV